MTNEELFDAYRQVVSQRDQLATAGDGLWHWLKWFEDDGDQHVGQTFLPQADIARWKAVRGIGTEPPIEDWSEC